MGLDHRVDVSAHACGRPLDLMLGPDQFESPALPGGA
jgi:hypothetical protein